MLPLRYPRLWMLPGWILVVIVIVGSVIPDAPLRALRVSDDIMHGSSYAVLMIWFAGLYARNRHVWIALGVLTLGVAMELVQSRLSYRTFDPADMLANAVGVSVGFALSFWFLAGWCQRVERQLISRHAGR